MSQSYRGRKVQPGEFRRAAGALTMALFAVSGCTTKPPPSVKDDFLARRLLWVDPKKPCYVDPFPPMDIRVVKHAVFLPVTINGINTIGRLDTGTDVSLITPEIAAAAKLAPIGRPLRVIGVSGSFATQSVLIDHIDIGSISFKSKRLGHVFAFGGSHGKDVGALVGLDWLDHLDYDIDFKHEKLRPYRTSNCIEVPLPWHDTYTGLALTRGYPGEKNPSNSLAFFGFSQHISVPVAFDGGVIDAWLDTGAYSSLMSHDAALDAGATRGQLNADPIDEISGLNGDKRKFIRHRFAHVALGEEEFDDFPVLVSPAFDRRDSPMMLGMDFLNQHHLWLSLTTNALYIDSGEPKKPVPPLDHAHSIGGTTQPGFPDAAKGQTGTVNATCMVEADGSLDECKIRGPAAQKIFADAVLSWLTGNAGPLMQPAYLNGHPIRQAHDWSINFAQ